MREHPLTAYRHELASACLDRAYLLLDLGRPAEALASSDEAREILVDINRLDPENLPFRRFSLVYLATARAHEGLGHADRALLARLARLPILERIVRDHPDDSEAPADLEAERKAIAAGHSLRRRAIDPLAGGTLAFSTIRTGRKRATSGRAVACGSGWTLWPVDSRRASIALLALGGCSHQRRLWYEMSFSRQNWAWVRPLWR